MQKIQKIICNATSDKQVSIPDNAKNIVLYFYPKDDTSGCTTEGQNFNAKLAEFEKNNCIIYGVSRDNMKSHEKFKAEQEFDFELIADVDEVLCNEFGVIQEKMNFGKKYMGIVRSTFVIASTGEVLKSWDKVKVVGHIDEVLEFVKSL